MGTRAASILLLLGLAGAIPASCGGEDAEDRRVVVVGSQWYGHCPAWIGIEKGIFAKAGFEVEWKPVANSVDRILALSSGDAQFASLGEIAMLTSMAAGNRSFYWVGNQDIAPGFEGIVARSGIETLADLKGRKVGVQFASSVDITARLLLRKAGLDPRKDVTLVNLQAPDVPTALRSGNIDAGVIWEPQFSQMKAVPGAKVLGLDTDTEIYGKFGTMTGPDVLIVSRSWADASRERAKRFIAAYFEAVARVKDHPAEAAAVAAVYTRQPVAVVEENLRRIVWNTAEDQARILSDEGMFGQAEYVARLLHEELGMISSVPAFREWVPADLIPAD